MIEKRIIGNFHKPVLLKEAIEYLNVSAGRKYIDATVGGAGHTQEILLRGGIVLGIDRDKTAIDFVQEKIKKLEKIVKGVERRLVLVKGNFSDIARIAASKGFINVAGILFDLGVSSYQLDKSGRGFSFRKNEPLDMRMDEDTQVKAADILNSWSEYELYNLFSQKGEEPLARAISHSIVVSRRVKPIKNTRDLVDVLKKELGRSCSDSVLARVFQALRIEVNSELENLKKGLDGAFELLAPGGRLVVISFHSLEDRIVKNMAQELTKLSLVKSINGVIRPSREEIRQNTRARSAKMRIIEKI
jgi:16S rRNA (cytosine1402-N4)-methyltransferase